MKRNVLLFSMIAALVLAGCSSNQPNTGDTSKEGESSVVEPTSSVDPASSASSSIPISYEAKQ